MSAEEILHAMQAQMAAMQTQMAQMAERVTQNDQAKANMEATFNSKMAEMIGVHEAERRGSKDDRDLFEAKHFRLCKVFDGSSTGVKWEEWQFDFLRAVSSRSADCSDEFDDLLKEAGTTKDVTKLIVDQNLSKYGAQLFNVLCGLTTGEANLIVRSTNDKGMGY